MRTRDLPVFVTHMLRALRDSSDVEALLTGEEISSVDRMGPLVPILEATEEGRAMLAERPRLTSAEVDLEALRKLPDGSLGRAWLDHLDRNGLDLDALAVPVTRGKTPVENWLLERVRQTHDIWHTVLGLSTQAHEEVLAHTFQWPQLQMPYSWLVVTFGIPKHFLLEWRPADLRRRLPSAWRAGQRARPLIATYWERRWQQPLEDLRRELNVTPADRW